MTCSCKAPRRYVIKSAEYYWDGRVRDWTRYREWATIYPVPPDLEVISFPSGCGGEEELADNARVVRLIPRRK